MTHYITKTQIKKDFTYIRHLLRLIETELERETPNYDFSEEGELGQLANELIGVATNVVTYRVEHELGYHKVKSCGCPIVGETHQEGCKLNLSLVQ
jgi:hypothetical protein